MMINNEVDIIRDWLPWSLVNIIFGWGLLGFLSFILSMLCRSYRRENDLSNAQRFSRWAFICNIIATVIGLLGWILFIIVLWI
jgi:hypothetical protein